MEEGAWLRNDFFVKRGHFDQKFVKMGP